MTELVRTKRQSKIIPYQELLGNYDVTSQFALSQVNYTIPRAIREL